MVPKFVCVPLRAMLELLGVPKTTNSHTKAIQNTKSKHHPCCIFTFDLSPAVLCGALQVFWRLALGAAAMSGRLASLAAAAREVVARRGVHPLVFMTLVIRR